MKVRLIHITCLAWAALVMGSCSDPADPVSEPEPQPDLQAIVFAASQQQEESVTRAETPLKTYTTTFQAYGYKNMSYDSGTGSYGGLQQVFPGYKVNWIANSANTTTTNTDGWEYVHQQTTGAEQTIKYWDWEAKAYRFFGYALCNSDVNHAVTVTDNASGTTPATTVTFSANVDAADIADAPYLSQLWFSDGNNETYPDRQFGKPVKLVFTKPFARVRFMFTFVDGLTYGREMLSNIKFGPTKPLGQPSGPVIATVGTVKATYPLEGTETVETWSTENVSGIPAFTIDYYEANTFHTPDDTTTPEVYDNTPEKWYTVLPALTQGSYTVEVSVVTDEIKTAVVPAEYMSWKPGYEYTYKFKITEKGGITLDIIQVAINDWSNKKSSNHSVYNW